MDAVKVGGSIAFLRKGLGMTQKDLAEKINVTDKAVSRWERGMGFPDISLLVRLSAALDVDIEALLAGNFACGVGECHGLLGMHYSAGISAASRIGTQYAVCFQLGFFLLAGIRTVCLRGSSEDVAFAKKELGSGTDLGIELFYEETEDSRADGTEKSDYFLRANKEHAFLVVDGLDFLYGRGITSFLSRLIFDSDRSTRVVTHKKEPTSFLFVPAQGRRGGAAADIAPETCSLGRGVICFPIQDSGDLADAGAILRIIEKQQHEVIGDLHEIARNRGTIGG